MAINTLTTSGKWATGGNWSLGKPTAAQDCVIPSGKEVKIEAESVCRSLTAEGVAKVLGTSPLTIGNSEKPEGPAGNSWALKISSEAVWSYSGAMTLNSSAAETQKLGFGGLSLPGTLSITGKGAKYLLESALQLTGAGGLTMSTETWLETAGLGITSTAFTIGTGAKVTLKLGSSTITLTSGSWEAPGATSTVEFGSATFAMKGAGTTFAGNGFSYGTLTIAPSTAGGVVVTGANTFGTLNINNKAKPTECKATLTALSNHLVVTSGESNLAVDVEVTGTAIPAGTIILAKIEAGVWEMSANATETVAIAETVTIYPVPLRLGNGVEQKVTTVTTNGTESEPARIRSNKNGTAATLGIPEQETTGWLRLRDTTVPTGPWYLPSGTDRTGNSTIGTTIKLEAKPNAFSGSLANSVGLKLSLTGQKASQGSLSTAVGAKTSLAAQKISKGSLANTLGVKQTLNGQKIALGVLANSTGLRQSLSAFKGASGSLTNAVGLKPSITGSKSSTGLLASSVGLAVYLEAKEVRSGSLSLAVGLVTSLAGQKITGAPLGVGSGYVNQLSGSRTSSVSLRVRVGLATIFSGEGSTDIFPGSMRITSTKQASISVSHRKQANLTVRSHT